MAQKKCPKCGEDNPAEAVMCWACYTPLAGGPAAAAAARPPAAAGKPPGPGGPGAADEGDGEKKKLQLDPKVIGVLAFLLIGGGLGVAMNTGMLGGGGGGEDDGDTPPPAAGGGGGEQPAQPQGNGAPPTLVGGGGGPVTAVSSAGTLPPAEALPYTPIVPPNPKEKRATIGIVPAKAGSITSKQAASLARFAKGQYSKAGRWASMQIFVFDSQSAAQSFGDYQARKRGTPLAGSDYQSLANNNVWSRAPACFESNGKSEFVYYPNKNPQGWWSGRKSG